MRNPFLDITILKVLSNCRHTYLLQSALMTEIDLHCSHYELTYNSVVDSLRKLEQLGLIVSKKDLLDYTRWQITEKGLKALQELSFDAKK